MTIFDPGIKTGEIDKRIDQNSFEYGLYMLKDMAAVMWGSKVYFLALLGISSFFLLSGSALEGCLFMAVFMSFMLVFCSDALASLLPLLLLCLMTTDYYTKYSHLVEYWWAAVLIIISLIMHFVMYTSRTLKISGYFTNSLTAVSAAVILGGLGYIAQDEYFSPVSLYYIVGLGIGMLFAYIFIKSELRQKRIYNVARKFAAIIYVAGLFAGVVVFTAYIRNFREFIDTFTALTLEYRNFGATFLVFAMPMSCVFIRDSKSHFGGLVFMYIMTLFTGSRSGLIFGTVVFVLCLVYIYMYNPDKRKQYKKYAAVLTVPLLLIVFYCVKMLFASRMLDGIEATEDRFEFFAQGIQDFILNPFFGCGLGCMKNSYIYMGVQGSLVWYHNEIIQIFASLGLFGAVAYGWQMFQRIKLILRKMNPYTVIFVIAYTGMLLISLTNPGELCPFPNQLLVVFMFAIIETFKDKSIKHKIIKPVNE